jgi:ABC-type multidrug transport system fused ATPase/permease subunit
MRRSSGSRARIKRDGQAIRSVEEDVVLDVLRGRDDWKFFSSLARADRGLAALWWVILVLRGILPALFAIVAGMLVGAVQRGEALIAPLVLMGIVFVPLQVLPVIHRAVGTNLGSRVASWLYDRLAVACVKPAGMGHLESAKLTSDLTMARDFDLAITGPPMSISMDFIASGLVEMVAGLAAALVLAGYAWWAPVVLAGAWLATHWLLREAAIWRDRNTEEVRAASRDADYAYRLAVEAGAAKELRLFGLANWVVDRFRSRRQRLFELRWEATRLRERPVLWSVLLVLAANIVVFSSIASAAINGTVPLDRVVTYATAAIMSSTIAFGGLSWALDGAAAPVAAVYRLEGTMESAGALGTGTDAPTHEEADSTTGTLTPTLSQGEGDSKTGTLAQGETEKGRTALGLPTREICFRNVRFAYPDASENVLDGFDLTIPAGSSLAIVGQNGAGKTTLAKLLCRLYDPQAGSIAIDGVDLREFDLAGWRSRVAAVFQDFIRFELPLRDNVAPAGASDANIRAALLEAGAAELAGLDTVLSRAYAGGTDLSGGQWQRVALARALCAVRAGAGVVLLDEPTAQLDVRGEAEIFDRILSATRHTTTILISHRFSTVRHADRICVLEHGRVVELGTHDELMTAGGRYRTMFDLQASRFGENGDASDEEGHDVLS